MGLKKTRLRGAALCALLLTKQVVNGTQAPFTEVEDYVVEFYKDFLVNEQSYYNNYYSFLATHSFDVNPSYSKAINQILEGGEDVTAVLEADPGLATNLYYMVTEFPWYPQFSATATAPNPTVSPYQADAVVTSVTAQALTSTSPSSVTVSPPVTGLSSLSVVASITNSVPSTSVTAFITSNPVSITASRNVCIASFSSSLTGNSSSPNKTQQSVAVSTTNGGFRQHSVFIFTAVCGFALTILVL
jgi:hypothetical protein